MSRIEWPCASGPADDEVRARHQSVSDRRSLARMCSREGLGSGREWRPRNEHPTTCLARYEEASHPTAGETRSRPGSLRMSPGGTWHVGHEDQTERDRE